MPLIKVWNFDRSVRKLILADSLNKVIKEGSLKLGYSEKKLFKVVMESDGTEVDSDEIFQVLIEEELFPETVLLLIPDDFIWSQPTLLGTSQQSLQLVKESEGGSLTTDHPFSVSSDTFRVPWEHFPKRLSSSCEKSEIPEPCLVRKMIRIVAEAVINFNAMPERSFIRLVAQTIVNKFPVLGNPNIGTEYNFETIFNKLENCIQNLRRPLRLSRQSKKQFDVKKKRVRKYEYGCVQWQPILPENEDTNSQEEIRKWLVEAQKTLSTDIDSISLAMEKTYSTQRLTINSKAPIQGIKENWPYLFYERYFLEHGGKLLGIEVRSVWNESLKKVPSLISYFRTLRKRNKAIDKVILKVEEAVIKQKSRMPEISCLLKMLCTYFGEKESQVASYFEVTTSLSAIQDVRKRENLMNPSICILGDSLFNSKGYVFLEDTVIGGLAEITDLMPLFFTSFYVFNICYPVGVEATLEFLQREFFDINPPGHKRGGKKRRTAVHPKVATLQFNLQHHNSQ